MFDDRHHAGRQLADRLRDLDLPAPVVLGLPRGGVPVAAPVAEALDAPLDIILVRKLGVPHQPELAMGAIGEDGIRVVNEDVLAMTGTSPQDLEAVEAHERAELEARAVRYRRGRPREALEGRTAIVVDDGIATGSTARAALQVARAHGAPRVVLAVPVAPPRTCRAMQEEADTVVCLEQPERFWAVGQFYRDFSQTTDDEVIALLDQSARPRHDRSVPSGVDPGSTRPEVDEAVELMVDGHQLGGLLTIPATAVGLVLFAHGSGSGRHSPRNQAVARHLNRAGLGTLLFDLLDEDEAVARANVFDIELLAGRLAAATDWVQQLPVGRGLPVGYFGASTGAAAAIAAAATPGAQVGAVVSRGGRPDLAGPRLGDLRAPILLLVGSRDEAVLELNQRAATELSCEHRLEIVPGATHLFEEPGTLDAVAVAAAEWFLEHLAGTPS
jgi:putative phosphoribosyl transferase